MTDEIKLSIVIVSWNVKKLLKNCLQSIEKFKGSLSLEIIVVDNASHDQTVEMLKQEFPQVILIPNSKNLGFAAANNQGILRSRGQFILLLNPDTEIVKNKLERIIKFIENKTKAGVVSCKHLNPDWTLQPSVRRFPNFLSIFLIGTKIAKLLPNMPPIYKYLARDFDYKTAQPIDQVAGSFFLIRREVIDQIGLLDEDFFIWFEEVDYCRRARNRGWEIWYTPDFEIIHYGGQSFNQVGTLRKQKLFFKSAAHYLAKHGLK
ncbi:MAG: glycosyltransferase family 2 protein [Patescibacteria group bacterium]|jgi:GT2 family glycosyltransferase|nr:glycosyltransferase family 2 protein [Patescibacteria group bacterium]